MPPSSASRIAQLFRLQSAGALRALDLAWGWTIPLHHSQLRLRSLSNPRDDDWIGVDRRDGSIDLHPHLCTPALIHHQDELLRDLQRQLPRIVRAWTSTLVAVGQLSVIPVPTACWITIHPCQGKWERNIRVPVDWTPLIGRPNPMMANLSFEEDLTVAVLGTEDSNVKLDLAELLWPGVRRFGPAITAPTARAASC